MFKLKKILNKHNNAPELEVFDMDSSTVGEMEKIYNLSSGKISAFTDDQQLRTLYVCHRVLDEYAIDRKVECFRITPDMIFEVKCTAFARAGDKFVLSKSSEIGGYDQISIYDAMETITNHGYVVDTSNQKTTGKILIRFHCSQ